MEKETGITFLFGTNLATLLAQKISVVHPSFDQKKFIRAVSKNIADKTLLQRVLLIAEQLNHFLPAEYPKAVDIIIRILGPENEKETGMFTNFYWQMPLSKFIEMYGLENFEVSMKAIEEITKRNTGEYAIRPYVRKYPAKTLRQMKKWAASKNFHLRRLASEGLRPKLPWASKLDLFIEQPAPVFAILDTLKEDPVRFVKKSVANHINDYIKVNPAAAHELIGNWRKSRNEHTQWIIRHATRNLKD
ncbi:MAG: 3-methyladenine DNA glycosylase [Chitinophagaceae bacterium]|nr:MAG: 3-methyladenine DNA glycosylase [Chitinophagaceae bacterium]